MKPNRQTIRSVGRLLLAIGMVCLFVAGTTGFSFLHEHDEHGGAAPHHCTVCLAHATSSAADVAETHVAVVAVQSPATPIFAANDRVVSHAPLTADSRGPPAVL
jgi:dihydrodipicolinate synthase/N-acetylneuraminate lyase